MEYEARTLDSGSSCVCDHTASQHRAQSLMCLAVEHDGHSCSCTEFRPAVDVALLAHVQTIRHQLDAMRAILGEARKQALLPQEKLAVAELARALAELTDAVRRFSFDTPDSDNLVGPV